MIRHLMVSSLTCAVAIAVLGAGACGGNADVVPDGRAADASTARDSSVADTALPDTPSPDAASPDAASRDAASPDAASPDAALPDAALPDAALPVSFISNTPNATVADVGIPRMPNLMLISSNLLQRPSGNRIFQEWTGEVRNIGSTTVCQVGVDVRLENANGDQLAAFEPFGSADPYMVNGLSLSIDCIPPGQVGTFYGNGFAPIEVSLSAVSRIAIVLTVGPSTGATPAPHAPIITSHVGPLFSGFGVIGMLTGRAGPIYNIGLDFFPRDGAGLVSAWLFATDLETLNPGSVFSFTSISTPTSFTEYRQFARFIDGPKPTADRQPPQSLLVEPVAAREIARREQRQASQARAVSAGKH
jgi:hypothetical protein